MTKTTSRALYHAPSITPLQKLGPIGVEVAQRIKDLRTGQKMNCTQLAELTGHPVIAIRRIEQGARRVDVDDLFLIAEALEVTPTYLIYGDNHRRDRIPCATTIEYTDDNIPMLVARDCDGGLLGTVRIDAEATR